MGPSKQAVRMGIITDTHFPFQDDELLLEALALFEWFNIDVFIHLGDLVDAYECSRHRKQNPDPVKVQEEVDMASRFLFHARSRFPQATMHLMEGNHCERIPKYIAENAPALRSFRGNTLPEMLRLEKLRCSWTKYKSPLYPFGERGRFECWHGHRTGGQNPASTAYAYMKAADINSGCSGHRHKQQLIQKTCAGHTRTWLEIGMSARFAVGEEYDVRPDWTQGIAIGWYYPDTAETTLTPIEYRNGRLLAPGWM